MLYNINYAVYSRTLPNFEEFHGKDLSLFIDYLEILDEMDGNPSPARIADEDAINLMTIHSAKGLEFKVVFVTNLAKDKFPLYRGGAEPLIPPELMEQYRDIFEDASIKDTEKAVRERKKEIKKEEERRLAYVALTRAKEHLFLALAIKYADISGFEGKGSAGFQGTFRFQLVKNKSCRGR
jgi:DNA helicase-2/ATP-dependent DNA helicase PcrA